MKLIHTTLKLLGINERFIFHTLEHYKKMDDIINCPLIGVEGRECVTEKHTASKHCECHLCTTLSESPSQEEASHMWNERVSTVICFLCNNSHLGAYQCCVNHLLNARLKERWLFCCKKLLKWFSKTRYCDVLFTNEKIFCIKEKVNWQNDRILTKNCYKSRNRVPKSSEIIITYPD